MINTSSTQKSEIKLNNQKLWEEYLKSEKTDIRIRNKIVVNNLKLAQSEAHRSYRMSSNYMSYEDLEQQAMISLIWAVEKFNPDKGYQFSTFAVPVIRGRLMNFIRDKSSIIKVPRRIIEEISDYKKIENRDKNNLKGEDKKAYKKLCEVVSVCRFYKPLENDNLIRESSKDDSIIFDTKFSVTLPNIGMLQIKKIISKKSPTPFDILEYRKICKSAKIKTDIQL